MCRKCVVLHISDICFVQIYTFSTHRANISAIFVDSDSCLLLKQRCCLLTSLCKMWQFYYAICGIFIIPFVPVLLYQISPIYYTICSFYGYKEPHPTLFKDAEYGLDNPPDNHECELYETYQYVTAKHHYQESAQK